MGQGEWWREDIKEIDFLKGQFKTDFFEGSWCIFEAETPLSQSETYYILK